jgi:hypothetical protein
VTLFWLCVVALTGVVGPAGSRAEEVAPQRATPDDMKLFAPYIGTFRSPTYLYDDGKTEHHFTISYQWFDVTKTIVKFAVATVIPSQARSIVNSEGFYWYDPLKRQVMVFGAFTRGATGFGSIAAFDHKARTHTLWATSTDDRGAVTHVRDMFEVIDQDTWKNKTYARIGDEAEWRLVHEGTYTREAAAR